MIDSIRYNLNSLARFSGRDRRGSFWPYAGAVLVAGWIAGNLVIAPLIFESFARMQRFGAAHPELTTVASGPGHYSISISGAHPGLMPDFRGAVFGMAAVAAITVLLLAAAVTRRLHDRGRSGAWGLAPFLFFAIGAAGMLHLFARFGTGTPSPGLFFAIFLDNLLYLASLVFLVVQLASAGTNGPNRYGADAE
jgi:uncharacterized membrane protein YhaH (DUF805 family)